MNHKPGIIQHALAGIAEKIVICVLCGLILSLPFRGYDGSLPAWVALAPVLFLVARSDSWRQALVYALGFSLPWAGLSFTFLWPLTPVGTVALSIYTALFYIMVLMLVRQLARRGIIPVVFGTAALWALVEIARSSMPVFGFPWLLFGHTLLFNASLRQGADLLGVYGLSFMLVAVNGVLAFAIPALWKARRIDGESDARTLLTLHSGQRSARWAVSLCGALVLSAIIYGQMRIAQLSPRLKPGQPIGVVQGNTIHKLGRTAEELTTQVKEHLDFHGQIISERQKAYHDTPVLICWAETMVPGIINSGDEWGTTFKAGVARYGVPTLTGANCKVDGEVVVEGRIPRCHNSACLFDKNGKEVLHYSKRRLVPFGEYVPFAELPLFSALRSVTRDQYVPGTEPSPVFEIGGYNFALNICVEDIFPDLAREAAAGGADALINITNDGWFYGTYGPRSHLHAAAWRSIETRRPMLRVTNTGCTVVIDPLGQITQIIPEATAGICVTSLPRLYSENGTTAPRTLSMSLGEFGEAIVFLLILSASLVMGKGLEQNKLCNIA